jgi:hypothetical protein
MKMIFKLTVGTVLGAGLMLGASLTLGVPAAQASETGLHIIHILKKEHGRVCMAEHTHYGSAGGRSRASAQAESVKSWAQLVALEYGTVWAHFSYASNKVVKCKSSSGIWSCDIEGRPCR